MKKISVIIIVFVIKFWAVGFVSAQNNDDKIKVLNNYINYVNETVHALWMIHVELENYNLSLNKFGENRRNSITFKNKNYMNLKQAYKTIPAKIYQTCISESKLFSKQERKVLNQHLNNLKNILDNLQYTRDSISKYTNNGKYLIDKNLTKAYKMLANCKTWFKLYNKEKEQLYKTIKQINNKYMNTDTSNSYILTANNLNELLDISKTIVEAVRQEDIATLRSQISDLKKAIRKCEKSRDKNLKGLKRLGSNNGFDPYVRYNHIIREAKAFYENIQSYLNNDKYVTPYQDKGRTYYYYNYKIINKYNRYGGGVVYYFNEFIELADVKILKKVEATHWFKVSKSKEKEESVTINKGLKTEDKAEQKPVKSDDTLTEEIEKPSLEGFASNNMIFLLDISGSMKAPEKLPVLKQAFKYLLTLMRQEDYVAIVTYSGKAKVELNSTSSENKGTIIKVIDSLKPEGGTNIIRGLTLSYKVALDSFIKNGNNRIILATDGGFEINRKFYKLVQKNAKKNIALTVIYLGKSENRSLSKKFTKTAGFGNGNYIHVTEQNAKQVLIKEAQSMRISK
jgi:Ca-activated chloride channel family protein